MSDKQAKAVTPGQRAFQIIKRVALVLLLASAFTFVLNYSSRAAREHREPAGFALGLLHGAMMPGAMPRLLIGSDVTIYAEYNNGRPYKLGYTMGVNGCGALFFGVLYYRFNRWRKQRTGSPSQPPAA